MRSRGRDRVFKECCVLAYNLHVCIGDERRTRLIKVHPHNKRQSRDIAGCARHVDYSTYTHARACARAQTPPCSMHIANARTRRDAHISHTMRGGWPRRIPPRQCAGAHDGNGVCACVCMCGCCGALWRLFEMHMQCNV